MTKKIIRAKGSDACPRGHYALYDHPNCNNSVAGRVLVADESVGSFGEAGDGSMNDSVTSVVNKTTRTLQLYEHGNGTGERLDIPPGGPYDLREVRNEKGRGLNDVVSSTRLGDPPSSGLLDRFRRLGYQTAGGSVDKDSGKGQGSSGPLGGLADLGFVASGGKMAGKDTQSEQVAAAEKAAAAKAATPVVYAVRILTADEHEAGTTDDIHVRFRRGDRESDWVLLDLKGERDLRRGFDDTYRISAPGDFGDPKRIEFKTSGTDDWLLKWINVTSPDGKSIWHCPLLNSTKVWLTQDAKTMDDKEDGYYWAVNEVSLFLGPGEWAVEGESNPDGEAFLASGGMLPPGQGA
ncbi:hypothetical protein GCM10022403_079570 [Streptomyces coacervatus]|uniref:PLAT domain-containing protein n=1 Tax=Streptomyces coacervatus TaxID=647381 RepID=A0ABP7J616_9ACTN|nr:PLAT/LH2 domain-containing protein [Streptomyces coacervatus]MDF2269347.1 PLAT/LH2 domain-containing protein [Streptomyces coacervatus]